MSEKEVRLIDARKISNDIALYLAENAYLNDTALDALKMAARWVNEAPTVDLESLRPHGNWSLRCNSHLDTHTGEYDDEFYLECSVCRRQVWDIDIENTTWLELVKQFPYCHCGAKMNP